MPEHRVDPPGIEVEGPAPLVVGRAANAQRENVFQPQQAADDGGPVGPGAGPGDDQPVAARLDRIAIPAVTGDPGGDVPGVADEFSAGAPAQLVRRAIRTPRSVRCCQYVFPACPLTKPQPPYGADCGSGDAHRWGGRRTDARRSGRRPAASAGGLVLEAAQEWLGAGCRPSGRAGIQDGADRDRLVADHRHPGAARPNCCSLRRAVAAAAGSTGVHVVAVATSPFKVRPTATAERAVRPDDRDVRAHRPRAADLRPAHPCLDQFAGRGRCRAGPDPRLAAAADGDLGQLALLAGQGHRLLQLSLDRLGAVADRRPDRDVR